MRGLLEKDFRLTLTRKQTLLIFFVMAIIMSMSMDGSFLIGYLTMLASIVALGTISYDEFENGFPFLMTLPFDRKTYVREKYVFCFLMAAAAWCVGAVMYCVTSMIRHNVANPVSELSMLITILPVMYVSVSILIPLQLKYGQEKSRTVLFIIFGIIAVIIFGANSLFKGKANPFASLASDLSSMPRATVVLAITAICALAVFISYLFSTRVMENKEF